MIPYNTATSNSIDIAPSTLTLNQSIGGFFQVTKELQQETSLSSFNSSGIENDFHLLFMTIVGSPGLVKFVLKIKLFLQIQSFHIATPHIRLQFSCRSELISLLRLTENQSFKEAE